MKLLTGTTPTTRTIQAIGIAMAVLLMTACASSPYREAEGRGYGYTEQQITQEQYRITFKARGDDTGKATDYAMLRASEVAIENEFDWFVVTSRDTQVNRERQDRSQVGMTTGTETVQSCGLLSCRTYQRPVSYYDTSMHLGNADSDIEVTLEVRMGTGIRPSGTESFDAREVHENLKPENA